MTWITPFLHLMSVTLTVASPILTTLSATVILNLLPWIVSTSLPSSLTTSSAMTLPFTAWAVRIAVSFSLSFNTAARVSLSILAKASFVGANTVNGPSPLRVSARPAALIAVTRVLKSLLAIAVSTIVFSALSSAKAGADTNRATAKASNFFMGLSAMRVRSASGKTFPTRPTILVSSVGANSTRLAEIPTISPDPLFTAYPL